MNFKTPHKKTTNAIVKIPGMTITPMIHFTQMAMSSMVSNLMTLHDAKAGFVSAEVPVTPVLPFIGAVEGLPLPTCPVIGCVVAA
jgi:hypothetical protein